MSPSQRHADNRRTTARVALFMVVAVMTTLVVFGGGSIGAISFAQQTTPAPTIQFMNPDDDTSDEVTAVNDGTDEAYHLVAWVSSLPPNATVQFKYQQSGQQEVTIGTATQTAIPDTFEFFWQRANMPPDGAYTLKAQLFSGSTKVAEDTQAVTINNEPPPDPPISDDDDVPNAVEIVYPVNGGRVGFYTNAGVTAAQIDVSTSNDTEDVTVYYTKSSPGTDPVWQECGNETRANATRDGVRCVLEGNDTPEQVRGIAAVAGDSNTLGLADTDSADAHRANGYTQDPFSVTLTPPTQRVDPPTGQTTFPCSGFIVAKVFDQFGRRVVGVNVDVHAAGPLDRLAFDDPGTANDDSSPHKAPDQGGHTNEPEADCEGSNPTAFSSSSQQGEHEVNGEGDIKHIESAAGGTNESGEFRFRMASGGAGVTQITAWADEDGNDRFCSQEAHADASISWGQAEATPTGLPAEQTDCPRPTGPATGTQSPTTQSPTTQSPTTQSPTTQSPSSPPPSTPPDDPRGCTKQGTEGNDTLNGTEGRDVICGYGGNDVIRGLGGNDVLYGDDGTDTVVGGAGEDEIFGGADPDSMRGGNGNDELDGGAHTDNINGRSGDDLVVGGGGPDTLTGGSGTDRLIGEGGKDVLKGGKDNDTLEGGNQADVLSGFAGNDRLFGQAGPDFMDGGNGRDLCRGGGGRDDERKCER